MKVRKKARREREELIAWLRHRPLLHREDDRLLVHGGLLPGWTADTAEELARGTEAVLRGADGDRLLADYALRNGRFEDDCRVGDPFGRAACALPVFTLIRSLRADGQPRCGYSGPPDDAPKGDRPWYDAWRDAGEGLSGNERPTVVFGHWASLGLHLEPGLFGVDTGCVWGDRLTAVRLDDGELWQCGTLELESKRK